ncbi:MAG TPA: hypothetical protein VIL73_02855 [Gaiellaceae bacterium]
MPKKVRTPPPPRRVQAPQRRETRRPGTPQRPPWLYAAAGALVAVVIAAAVLGFVLTRGGGNAATKTTATNYNALPGIRKTKSPWPPEYLYLADRLLPLGLKTLSQEGVATHIHAHLDIFVNGKRVTVPPQIGINPGANYLTELHTHDSRGVIHIESPKANDEFTLGEFFGEWAVFLNSNSVGGYKGMRWYVDGKQQTGNPANLILKAHQEITLVVGKAPAKIPSSYKFSPGE